MQCGVGGSCRGVMGWSGLWWVGHEGVAHVGGVGHTGMGWVGD